MTFGEGGGDNKSLMLDMSILQKRFGYCGGVCRCRNERTNSIASGNWITPCSAPGKALDSTFGMSWVMEREPCAGKVVSSVPYRIKVGGFMSFSRGVASQST